MLISDRFRPYIRYVMLPYPQYPFTEDDVANVLVRYVRLDNQESYPFDAHHSHQYHELLYFRKGGGTHSIQFREHPVQDHSLHLLRAGDPHWLERGLHSEGFALVYKEAFLYKLQEANKDVGYLDYFSQSNVLNLDAKEAASFALLIGEIGAHSANHLYLFSLVGAFLTKLVLEKPLPGVAGTDLTDPYVRQFYEQVQTHYAQRLRAEDYAQMLHLSAATLERKVQAATGKTVFEIGQDLLLKEAKRLLLQGRLSQKEIADRLGFREVAHFANWFRKGTAFAPGQYGKQ